jgi:hypothetical protein
MSTRMYTTVGGLDYFLNIDKPEAELRRLVFGSLSEKTVIELPVLDSEGGKGWFLFDGSKAGNVVIGNVVLGPDGLPMSG